MTSNDRHQMTPQLVLTGAVELADEIGIEKLTMRKLAAALGVKPMTIYHHVENKESIIDGMVDMVFSEIAPPPTGEDWKTAIRIRCISAREVLNRHPWAPPLMESRTTPGSETLAHHDAVLACLRRGGLSIEMTAHAYAIIDSYLYGFALQEAHLPHHGNEEIGEVAEMMVEAFPVDAYPHLVELTTQHVLQPGYSFGNSFEFGLDLILDGLERASNSDR